MIAPEIRSSVRTLLAQGRSLREVSRMLQLSRNTVRRILRQPQPSAEARPPCEPQTLRWIEAWASGNVVRVRQLLASRLPATPLRRADKGPRPFETL